MIVRKGSMASIQNSQTRLVAGQAEGQALALLRHTQVTTGNSPEHRSPIFCLSHPIARWDVLLCTLYCDTPSHTSTTPSQPPRATITHARDTHSAHTDSHSLHRFRIPPARPPAQRPRAGPRCGAPSHHTPTCQKGPLSQDFISVLTHPCPGPQQTVPCPALNVRPAPARGVPPCPSEPLLEFFSQE